MNLTPIKLFISYAREDEPLKEMLADHLSGLKRMGLIETWDDRMIIPGEVWDEEIKKALKEADIIIFLISAKFSASDYINNVEIKNALEYYQESKQRIIPVLVRPFHFESLPELKKFQTLPSNGKEVTLWENQNKAWVDVTIGITRVIFEIRNAEKRNYPEGIALLEYADKETGQSTEEVSVNEENDTSSITDHHKYLCNRDRQAGIFKVYYNKRKALKKRFHFFYFYGGDLQAHSGLFQRFVGRIRGINSPADVNVNPGYKVKQYSIRFPKEPNLEALEVEVPIQIMKRIGLKEVQIDNLEQKTLVCAIKESRQLNNLVAEDKVCVHISIPETRWDLETTPVIAKWLIKNFCLKGVTDDIPEFFIFFSVEYDEDNTKIREEIEEAMKDPEYTIGLPELGMVDRADITEWFTDCSELWEKKIEFKKVQRKWLQEFNDEMYMEEVQDKLEQIINEAKNPEKHANRNS